MATPPSAADPAVPGRRETPRLQLARTAMHAATQVPGVAALDPGPDDRYCTRAGAEQIRGVLAIAAGTPSTYAVTVHLVAELVDLHELSDRVRTSIDAAASRTGLAEHLGEVRVAITDIRTDRTGPHA